MLIADLRSQSNRLSGRMFLPAALVVFTASGFAGLIYESIWSHYLKLFLGHAAYAQSLVLMIFMGGMALGAWGASRLSHRWRNLLVAYALIEAVVGIAALAFHRVFVDTTDFAFNEIFPALGSPLAVHAVKWSLAAALILPQSVLLGMTFPLMTGGVLRVRPERSGYAIAMLYFTNSLGAAVGVLASAFYFIPAVGLPGTMAAAGVVNLAVAAAAILLPGRREPAPAAPAALAAAAPVPQLRLLLAVAALTGMSSFMYEIGWIRMLALVLGSSTHAFELMLSAFILGIAFGGLWVRRRIDAAADTVRLLGWVQLAMGLAALATLPIYGATFHAMKTLLGVLARTETGYWAFNLASHAMCLAIMFPAAFCAGMTLPLITVSLLRRGAGERAIGQVYAVNTAGAIAGVLIAVHLGFTLLGLKGLIIAGAAIDLALGIVLLRRAPAALQWRAPRFAAPFAAAVSAFALLGAALFFELDAHLMSSGVFRGGSLLPQGHRVHAQLHGKTATVSVTGGAEAIAVRTNGKVDGAVRIDGAAPVTDEITMTFAGALPLILAPQARQVANIGFGTGMTSHVLLASPGIERVDTIEIEPAMVKAGEHLRRVNWRALDDPRSRFHYEDAKTYFAAHRSRYDVIVSEPSNPWVSGTATLFSVEFYRDVRRYLKQGGLFLQWVQLYETTPELLATIVAALEENFSDYEFWLANDNDLLIVAANGGEVPVPDVRALENPALRAELERFRITNLDDLLLHRVAGRGALMPYFAMFGAPANSDYFPVLEMKAPLARYMNKHMTDLGFLAQAPVPVLSLFDPRARARPDPARLTPGERHWLDRAAWVRQASDIRGYMRSGSEKALAGFNVELASDLVLLRAALVDCNVRIPQDALQNHLADLSRYVSIHLPAADATAFWDKLGAERCAARVTDGNRDWLRLHRAVAAGEGAGIMRAANALLERAEELKPRQLAHALAAFMAGAILKEQRGDALRAFHKHRGRLTSVPEWQPVFRFLIAQADWSVTKIALVDKNGQPGRPQP